MRLRDSAGHPPTVEFAKAEVGQWAYTWENPHGDWGDYTFDTEDPTETGIAEGCEFVIRKKWLLVEVVEIPIGSEDA